jgi:hypothetical protein
MFLRLERMAVEDCLLSRFPVAGMVTLQGAGSSLEGSKESTSCLHSRLLMPSRAWKQRKERTLILKSVV